MPKFVGTLLALGLAAAPVFAQNPASPARPAGGSCASPDSIAVAGNVRVEETRIRGTAGLAPKTALSSTDVQRAIKSLFATKEFDDVRVVCSMVPATQRAMLTIQVKERPVLSATSVTGVKQVSAKDVRERLELPTGSAVDPATIVQVLDRADSLYESKGYYLAKIRVDSTITNGELTLAFHVEEGNRLAISGVRVSGNKSVPAPAIVSSMQTRPEGFLWYKRGQFDENAFAGDLTDRIPGLYGSRGYIDMRVTHDTMLVDRERGKGELQLDVQEGPRYSVGNFEVLGNRHFTQEQLDAYYPFGSGGGGGQSLAQGTLGFLRRSYHNPPGTFDQARWDDATSKLRDAYANEGYLYAQVRPIEERVPSSDTVRQVNLRWDVQEGAPAIINRVDVVGNDFTYESCIREQILTIPGDVFKRDYLIKSYQGISNLNFFESPLAEPTVTPVDSSGGDVNITYKVKEKRTGSVNFGASEGQGTGIGGFIGLDQPNLFGRCKRAQMNWQFGRYVNDFSLTYQDPNILQSRISGSVTAYHTKARYQIADLGQSTRTGGQLQFGFPIPNSYYSRMFLSYGGEAVKYDGNTGTLLGQLTTTCTNCFRSTLGLTFQRDTRRGMPFPTEGGLQSVVAQFNGGILGGTASFQKYTTELRSYAPLFYIGGTRLGAEPIAVVAGLSARGGAVMGNPGPFFSTQSFALGGTQYGEPLRGYCEFAITPAGYDPNACDGSARRESFGNAYFAGTAELGLRLNSAIYINTFFEAGNVWDKPRDFDPTRLYRSVGFGGSTLSPLGPLGLDIAYGLDRVDASGRKDPAWKLHFKLGQFF